MGGFVDWVGLVGGAISTVFAWTAFNRDSFADNVVMRQNQMYQQRNYDISWKAIARDDIRDMMGISVNRINNYMIVATLILSMAGGALTSLSFSQPFPGFLMYASYLSIGISIVFLLISIAFGVQGQNMAFCETMDLLTFEVRPHNPDTYDYDYMSQAQAIEKKGLRGLFRIPGVAPESYDAKSGGNQQKTTFGHVFGQKRAEEPAKSKQNGTSTHSTPSNGTAVSSPAQQPFEQLENAQQPFEQTQNAWYLHKFRRFMDLWQPFETWSKYSMSVGILSFGHGLAYWCLGKLKSEQRTLNHWAGLAIFAPYVYVVTLIAYMNLGVRKKILGDKTPTTKNGRRLLVSVVVVILVGGPVMNGLSTLGPVVGIVSLMLGGLVRIPVLQQGFVLCGYFFHSVFWLLCFFTTFQNEESLTYQDRKNKFRLQQSLPMFHEDLSIESGSADTDPMLPKALFSSTLRQRGNSKVMDDSADTTDNRKCTETPVEANAGDDWIVDREEFGRLANKQMLKTQCAVEFAIISSALMWAIMWVWVLLSTFDEFDTSFEPWSGVRTTRFSVDWPDPLFKPGQMACAAENNAQMKHVFVANKFSIYSLHFEQGEEHMKSSQKPFDCGKLEGEIIDMSALCDDYASCRSVEEDGACCRPIVLIRNDEFTKIVDCARPEEDSLLKWSGLPAPNFIEVKPDGLGLIVEQESSLVVWERTNSTSAWVPQYDIGIKHHDISDIDYGFKDIVFFRNVRPGLLATAIEQVDAMSMEQKRAWHIPQALMPLSAGCMMKEGVQALVLPSSGREVDSQYYLTRLDLHA